MHVESNVTMEWHGLNSKMASCEEVMEWATNIAWKYIIKIQWFFLEVYVYTINWCQRWLYCNMTCIWCSLGLICLIVVGLEYVRCSHLTYACVNFLRRNLAHEKIDPKNVHVVKRNGYVLRLVSFRAVVKGWRVERFCCSCCPCSWCKGYYNCSFWGTFPYVHNDYHCVAYCLCSFSSKIYLPSVFMFDVYNNWKRVHVCIDIFLLSSQKLDIFM